MANDPMETFVKLLSHVRQTTDRSNTIYEELAKVAENDEIKEASMRAPSSGQRNWRRSMKLLGLSEKHR